MGCDIHLYVEGKIKGEWVFLGEVPISRDYTLFGVLAGVRDDEIDCVSDEPRDIPEDATSQVIKLYNKWGEDAHTPSYLSYDELLKASEIFFKHLKDSKYIREFPLRLMTLNKLLAFPFIDDVRVIFWFDN